MGDERIVPSSIYFDVLSGEGPITSDGFSPLEDEAIDELIKDLKTLVEKV